MVPFHACESNCYMKINCLKSEDFLFHVMGNWYARI